VDVEAVGVGVHQAAKFANGRLQTLSCGFFNFRNCYFVTYVQVVICQLHTYRV
jgi:hypothetical protein